MRIVRWPACLNTKASAPMTRAVFCERLHPNGVVQISDQTEILADLSFPYRHRGSRRDCAVRCECAVCETGWCTVRCVMHVGDSHALLLCCWKFTVCENASVLRRSSSYRRYYALACNSSSTLPCPRMAGCDGAFVRFVEVAGRYEMKGGPWRRFR